MALVVRLWTCNSCHLAKGLVHSRRVSACWTNLNQILIICFPVNMIFKYKISFSWPETCMLSLWKIGTFVVTANTPLERGFNPALSCIPKADEGNTEETTVSSKRQVREHSRNPMLSSFWGSMGSPEGYSAVLAQPKGDGFFLGSFQGSFVWKVRKWWVSFYSKKLLTCHEHKNNSQMTILNSEHSQFLN